jgi:hypothetical protein
MLHNILLDCLSGLLPVVLIPWMVEFLIPTSESARWEIHRYVLRTPTRKLPDDTSVMARTRHSDGWDNDLQFHKNQVQLLGIYVKKDDVSNMYRPVYRDLCCKEYRCTWGVPGPTGPQGNARMTNNQKIQQRHQKRMLKQQAKQRGKQQAKQRGKR